MRVTELLARLRLDPSQFQSGLAQSQAELKRFAAATNALPGGRASLFGALAADAGTLAGSLTSLPLGIAAVGAAFTGAAVAARRAGVEFEASLARISSLGPEATAGLERTREAILETFATTPITGSITELADASFLLQSSGRSAAEALEDLPVAARSAVAGTTQVTVAVDGLTTVTNAWRESQLSSQTAADVLFQTVNEGKATFEELASQIGLVAPTAAGMGVRFQEVAAATAVLSVQGVRTSSIFEGLRSALLNIQSPTERFTRDYADLAREFTASRVARDGLVKFLVDFDRESGGSRQALRALFSDATAFNTALGLLKNGGADAQGTLQRMEESAGALNRAFDTINDTALATEQRVKNQISATWTQLGETINRKTVPALEAVARLLNDITDNAAFAATDVDRVLARAGRTEESGRAEAEQFRDLNRVVSQFRDNPTQFLRQVPTVDQLNKLAAELVRLRAEGTIGISGGMVLALREEATRRQRDAQAQEMRERDGDELLRAAAQKREEDEKAERKREEDRRAAEKAQADAQSRARAAAADRDRAIRETEAAIERLTAESTQALGGVQATLIRQLQQMVAESEKMLRSGYLSEEAKQRLQAQVELAKELQSDMINATGQQAETARVIAAATRQSQADALFNIEARQRELRAALAVTRNVQARALIEKQISELVEARERQTVTIEAPKIDVTNQKLREQVQLLGDLAQSIATAGDQLGVLPQRAVAALRGIGALAESGSRVFGQWSQLTALGKLAGGAGIAAGVASLAASLLGDSPEERARRQAMRENTDAIRTLSREIGDLSASNVAGRDIDRITQSLRQIFNGGSLTAVEGMTINRDAAGFLASRSGVSRRTIEELAADLRIDLAGIGGLTQLNEALRIRDLEAYSGSFAGTMQAFEDALRADGITDAVEVLRRRIETLTRPGTGFPALAAALEGLNVADVEQRATALERARALFEQVRAGQVPLAELGGLSLPDARNALLDLIQSLRDITSGGPAGTGGYQEVRTVSEVTASRLVGLTATSASYLRQIAADITALRERFTLPALPSIMPPALGALGLQSQAVMVTVQQLVVQVTLPAGTTAAEAGAIGQQLGRGIGATLGPSLVESIDVAMGRRQQLQRLFTGDLEVLPS